MFAIFMTIIASGIFGYSINNIGNIFGEFSKQKSKYRDEMNSLKKYLRQNGINKELS